MPLKYKARQGLSLLIFAVLLAGCAAPPPSPTPIPTIDIQPTLDILSTRAVQTFTANLTLNAPTATPVPPTSTSTPTSTALPTATPIPTVTPTRAFIPWSPTPTATQPAYSCLVTDVSPKANDTLKVEQDFDAVWSLKNNGPNAWSSANADFKYVSGAKLQSSGDIVDLKSDVAPNGTYTVTVDMKAPTGDGTFTTTWGLVFEDGSVCNLNLTINVTK